MRRFMFSALLCLAPVAACAQASVYGAIALTSYGASNTNGSTFYDKSGSAGFVVGGFYNFPIQSRLTAGLDLHLTNSPGGKGGTAGALTFRVGFVPQQVPLRPYFEIGGGMVSTSTNTELVNDGIKAGTYTNGAAIIAAGLDIRITPSIDIRAIELGAEAGGNSGVGFADAGVVYHFGHRP
jgi:hypothetical protein